MPDARVEVRDPSYKAYQLLHFGFFILPVLAGADKFFHFLVDWNIYLSPMVKEFIDPVLFMKVVGGIEIFAGLLVAFKPRQGAGLVALWLWCIIFNLLSIPGYFDIAVRDLGLSFGALALVYLAEEYSLR